MWFEKLTFFDKRPGLVGKPASDYLSKPLSADEINKYVEIQRMYHHAGVKVPAQFSLPKDFQQLLEYSNGGGIRNGDQGFWYFELEAIRYYYFSYNFPNRTPHLLPIAFNSSSYTSNGSLGSDKFYAYDFRDVTTPVVSVSIRDITYTGTTQIGKNLAEVLSKTTAI